MTLNFKESMLALAGITAIMLLGLFWIKAPITIIFVAELIFVTIIALLKKHPYKELQSTMIAGIAEVLTPILTLLLIGALVTSWIMSGTMPTLIYIGLKIIDARMFLLIAFLMCSLTSMAVGTSWGTISTLGLAFLGISNAMGIELAHTAAAVVSGAIFGDKLSPLSSSLVLVSELTGASLTDSMKAAARTTVPAFIVSIVLYYVLGTSYNVTDAGAMADSRLLMEALANEFTLGILPLLLPIILFALILMKIPNIPVFSLGIIMGVAESVLLQGCSLTEVANCLLSGFTMTGNSVIGNVLDYSGMSGMSTILILLMFASSFGGVVKRLGIINCLLEKLVEISNSRVKISIAAIVVHTVCFLVTGAYYAVNSILAAPLNEIYEKYGLKRSDVASVLLSGGTGLSPVIPWSGTGIFVVGALGLSSVWYCVYAPVLWLPLLLEPFTCFLGRKKEK